MQKRERQLPFSFSGIAMRIAFFTAAFLAAANGLPAGAAEYRDPKDVFTISYDEAVWTIKPGADGEIEIECAKPACAGTNIGCSVSRIWVPFGTTKILTESFDARDTENTLIDVLAKQKAIADKETTDRPPDAEEAAPTLMVPYTLRHVGGTHPVHEAELRVSFAGSVNRFISISTSASGYSMAFVCYAPEKRIAEWRPRFDALIEGFRPGPQPFWLRWLERLGL
jgi:hypothetical protein